MASNELCEPWLIAVKVSPLPRPDRIQSDTPLSRFTTLSCSLPAKNISFHYVWTVAYPLPQDIHCPIHRCSHEAKSLLAAHLYSSRLNPSSRGAAAKENPAIGLSGRRFD